MLATTLMFVLGTASCATRSRPTVPRSVDLLTIQGTLTAFAAAAAHQDLAGVGRVFAQDAVVVTPGRAAVRGHAAILDHYRSVFDERDVFVYLHVEHVSLRGDVAYCRGTLEEHPIVRAPSRDEVRGTNPQRSGRRAPMRARFHMLLRRATTGGWRIARLMRCPERPERGPDWRPAGPENRPV